MSSQPCAETAAARGIHFRHALRRLDVPIMILSALVSVDMIGQISSFGGETFTWLVVLAIAWMLPYGLITAELGSTFPVEGGMYEWVRLAFGRFTGCVAAMMYWSINPLWIGGSLAFLSTEAWSSYLSPIEPGTWGDYVFKMCFILSAAAISAISLERARVIFKVGTYLKLLLTVVFLATAVVYGFKNGFVGIGTSTWSPTLGGFLALVPLLLFSLVGFEVPSQAGEEMQNPQRDVPRGVAAGGIIGMAANALPVLALLLVLPGADITGISGFMSAVKTVFGVYGAAGPLLLELAALAFIFSLLITGATWSAAGNRALAVAAADGAFFPYFAKFDPRRQTPVRVSVLLAAVATVFMIAGVTFSRGDAGATFAVVLSITVSTSVISYLFLFPAALRLRFTHAHIHRPYSVPGGRVGMGVAAGLTTFWAALGAWVAVFPGTAERLFGVDYPFFKHWGISRPRFEVFALGTLAVLLAIALVGFAWGRSLRRLALHQPVVQH